MIPKSITAENSIFILLSFEGPDRYSLAGGLGIRITNLAQALVNAGFPTHLFFIGDPVKKSEEPANGERLTLHRWCQWISEYYPGGVYQGEKEKLNDFNESIPWFLVDHVVKPAVAKNKIVVILGEEWHTAEVMCRISDLLHIKGLRDNVVMFWNANNTFGFDQINWGRLAYTTTITTVSRYMKRIMSGMGLNPLVIPNGIPSSLLHGNDDAAAAELKKQLNADLILTKVARWDPDKRWHTAIEAMAELKARGSRPVLLARGGMEPYGNEVIYAARSLGLTVGEAWAAGNTMADCFLAVKNNDRADILNVRFHCHQDFLRVIYHASDAVLANSGHEPFGLVGLETMAAGGVAFTGGTGEDYAVHLHNSIVLDTPDPREIADYSLYLEGHVDEARRIRETARRTASCFTWERVIKNLTNKLEYQARNQGVLATLRTIPKPAPS